MSNFSVPVTDHHPGMARNRQPGSCRSPSPPSRQTPHDKLAVGATSIRAGNFAHPVLQSVLTCLMVCVMSMMMINTATAADPPAVAPYPGQLTYYATFSGYLCYFSGAPVGASESGVALTMAQMGRCPTGGFTKLGSGTYDGKRYSWYRENPQTVFPSCQIIAVTQYVCPDGTNNPSSPAYNCGGMPNARNNPNECCPCGYYFDPAQGMCMLMSPKPAACPSACPAHASGTPPSCVCDIGYKFDAAGTSCIPEQYTLSLSGLGVKVMPTKTLETAYAEVKKSDGSAGSGVQVDLALTVVPEEDGQLYSAHVGSISPNGGSTGDDGRLPFVFTAPVAGGVHTITATCTKCTNSPVTGTITVPGCSVEPLTEVQDIPPNDLDVLPLTLELERTRGAGLALLPDAQAGVNCVLLKEPGTVITGGTRTLAYQAHLKEVWDKSVELNKEINLKNKACQPLRDKVEAEKGCNGGHCITYPPATNSNHPKGTAFDVSKTNIKGLLDKLRPPLPLPPKLPLTEAQQHQADIKLMADWLASPAACNLVWGGSFTNPGPDIVHFQLP